MSITLHPYKLTLQELEARLAAGDTLLPGQWLRFEGESPAYGEVIGVRALSGGAKPGAVVRIRMLHGQPGMAACQVTVLQDAQTAAEVQKLLPVPEQPLALGGHFTGDLLRLRALTVIVGDDFVMKYSALMLLVSAISRYKRLLVIDPLGIFSSTDPVYYCRAGEEMRLSVQQVGARRFLGAFSQTFPEDLRELALRVLADRLPLEAGFTGFNRFLDLVSATDMPLKNLILQSLHVAVEARVFADTPQQVLTLPRISQAGLNVLDLSALPEPWKSLFYEEACRELYANPDSGVLPVLLYPERYLSNLESWIQKADEAELNLLVLASPYPSDLMLDLANNLIEVEDRTGLLSGDLTLGLPVSLNLSATDAHLALQHVARTLPSQPAPAVMPSPEQSLSASMPTVASAPVVPPPPLAGIGRNMPVVDLFAPQPERHYPQSADMPLPLAGEPQEEARTGPLTPDELSALVAGDWQQPDEILEEAILEESEEPWPQPQEPVGSPLASLPELSVSSVSSPDYGNYADADEGALPPLPAMSPALPEQAEYFSTAASSETFEAQPAIGPDADLFEPAGFEEEPFSFDVNLDQTLEAAGQGDWSTPAPAVSTVDERLDEWPDSPADFSVEETFAESQEVRAEQDSRQMSADLAEPFPGLVQQETSVLESAHDVVPVIRKSVEALPVQAGEFKPGDTVRHETYGVGVVNKVVPMDQEVILNITFEGVGKRLLDPARARLTREPG